MIAIILILFALPAALIAIGTMIYIGRGASRPSKTLRTLALIALPILGSVGGLVALICLGTVAFALANEAAPRRYRPWKNGRRRHGNGRGGYRGPAPAKEVRRMQLTGLIGLKCTNGWMPVHGGVQAVQSFKAPRAKIAAVDFRAARKLGMPNGALKVSVRDPRSRRTLASWKLREFTYGKDAVTRFFNGYIARLKLPQLEEGRDYELVFASPGSDKNAPWLINCFYRDTYPGGRYSASGRASRGRASLDLVFRLSAPDGTALVCSIPEGEDMLRREHFGLAYSELVRRLAGAVRPPVPGSDPSQPAVAAPLTAPGPKMTRKEALARARELGKPGGSWPDPFDSRLSWIPIEKKFLVAYDSREGSLTIFTDFLKMIGRKEVSVRGLAFTRHKVWAATSRGALVYDRRSRAWSQLAVNLDSELLEADFTAVRATGERVVYTASGGKNYSLDLKTNKWSATGR